jgi:NADH-quinone oxidoreductase subunit M
VSALLWAILLSPLVFGALIAVRPSANARLWALGGTMLNVLLTLLLLGRFDFASAGLQGESAVEWLPAFGLSLSIGIDSISVLLIALTALLGPICVLGSWNAIRERQRLFYGWFMVLNTAMVGVFMARDLALFYICFEFTLLPMFVLINEFGSSNRRVAAIKFFLYTFTGSLIALAGLVFVAAFAAGRTGEFSLDISTLTEHARFMTDGQQALVMFAMLAGFAVKVPLFPVHTWLPLAHTEAPTAGSVILAGVLLKLGTYAIYRFVLPLTPDAAYAYAPAIAVLSIIGIVYAGLICWVQNDVKKLVAYSSVSHLGFCVLGLFALNTAGLTGSILYMINHGLSTGALFLLIGFMYERYHTRDMREIGGLASKMPVWSTFMVFFVMASVGLPGLNGFVSEFLCVMGTFQSYTPWASGEVGVTGSVGATWGPLGPWFAAAAATGVIVAAIYLLTMTSKIVWGELREPNVHHEEGETPLPSDLNGREIACLAPLAVLCLAFGLYPKPLIDAVEGPVNEQVAFIQAAVQGDPIPSTSTDDRARDHGDDHDGTQNGEGGTP